MKKSDTTVIVMLHFKKFNNYFDDNLNSSSTMMAFSQNSANHIPWERQYYYQLSHKVVKVYDIFCVVGSALHTGGEGGSTS